MGVANLTCHLSIPVADVGLPVCVTCGCPLIRKTVLPTARALRFRMQRCLRNLNRILSSHEFAASERRRALLRFIVEETLAGRSNSLKGYTIALAVFGRQDLFDPQADPVVRLEARRLRRDLDSYYVGVGQQNPIRITIPKGSYIASFDWHACPSGRSEDPPQLNIAKRVKNGSRDSLESAARCCIRSHSLPYAWRCMD